ncbi:MAG: hypothetical protein V4710_18480 [Verrucomicrobiota bacterium]
MMREWVESELWDQCYFRPDRLGPKTLLYSTTFSAPLVTLLIDGYASSAPWSAEDFFSRLRPLAERHPCSWIYITNCDCAVDFFQWEQPYQAEWFAPRRLWIFEISPGEEGGSCYLALAFHDRQGMIVFTYDIGGAFEIAFYGSAERLAEIQNCI